MGDRPFSRSMAFKNGKLYLFKRQKAFVVRSWPPAAWTKSLDEAWHRCRPDLRTVIRTNSNAFEEHQVLAEHQQALAEELYAGQTFFPWFLESPELRRLQKIYQERTCRERFLGMIPMGVLKTIEPFFERHFALLSFCHACGKGAEELLQSNPALGFMVATNWIWHKPSVQRPLQAARRLLRARRRNMLEWLQFGNTQEAAVRILAKIPPHAIRVQTMFYLRDALRNPEALRTLGFLSRINAGAVRFVSDPRLLPLVSTSFLEEIGHDPDEDTYSIAGHLLFDTIQMQEQLEQPPLRFRLRSYEQLSALHRQAMADFNALKREDIRNLTFPEPPIPPSANIEPILSPEMLIAEGRLQDNCVASYGYRVALGRTYVYRVLGPMRATLSVVRRGKRWTVDQCLGRKNKPVDPETMRTVRCWIAEGQSCSREE